MARVTLTQQQINDGLNSGFRLSNAQFTFSIPTAASIWPGYAAGTQPANSYSILNAAQANAFRAAISLWDALIAPNFTETADDATTRGEVRVAFTSFDMPAGTAAYAFLPTTGILGTSAGDVWINSNSVGEDFSVGTDNFATLVHEIGHSLGLKHPFEGTVIPAPFETGRYSVMSYTNPGRVVTFASTAGGGISSSRAPVVASSPLVLDIAAIQAIYGADPNTLAGNTIYSFSAADASVRAIYDAGGIDTFDLSNITRDNVVDLEPGAYSSIAQWTIAEQTAFYQAQYNPGFAAFISGQLNQADTWTWTDNVGIALNTIIENVIGGSGDDTITGNSADNSFDLTRGGTDIVSGAGGNDSFSFGATWGASDRVDGGAGANDQIGISGNYTGGNAITLVAGQVTGVEVFAVLPGAGNSYAITPTDAAVAAGTILTIFGGNLGAGQNLTFNGAAETDAAFRVYGGLGTENVTTGAGDDGIYFGPGRYDPVTDIVVGGPGSNDQLALDGDYTATLTGAAIQTVEVIALLRGPDASPNTFNITLANSLTVAGTTLTVFASQVLTALTINGAAETDGNLRYFGGLGADTLIGGSGADRIWGNNGADTITGGGGADVFFYDAAVQSSGGAYDRIVDFVSGTDRFDLPGTVSAVAATISVGSLSAGSINADLAAVLGGLAANNAVLFRPNGGDLAGTTFLVVDGNGIAGYQADGDYVFQLVNNPVTVTTADFF